MFGSIRRLIGAVDVIEREDTIEVIGVPADVMARDITKIWETSRINVNMFVKLTKNSFSFPKFFAIDVLYMLNTMIQHRKSLTNVRALQTIIEKLETETWLADVVNVDYPKSDLLDLKAISALNVNLLPKQMEFLTTYNAVVDKYDLNGYLLAADPGTGKTISALALSLCLHSDLVVIVSPKNALHRVWEKEIVDRFKVPQHYWIAADGKEFDPKAKYLIIHYQYLDKIIPLLKDHSAKRPMVILDECHNMNESVSQQTTNFVALCKFLKTKHVLWQSGTPIKAMGYEMIPLLRTIDRYFTADVEERFKRIFGKNAARAVDILRNRLGMVMFRVEKSEVYSDKPIFTKVPVQIPNSREYLLSTIRDEMRKYIDERLAHYRSNMPEYQATYDRCLELHRRTLHAKPEFAAFDLYRSYVDTLARGYDPKLMKDEAMYCNTYELKKIIPSLPNDDRNEFKSVRSVIKYVELKVQGEALGRVLGRKRAQCHVDMIAHAGLEKIVGQSLKKTMIFTSYVDVLKEAQRYFEDLGFNTLVVHQDTNKDLANIVRAFEREVDLNPLIATYKSLSTAVPMVMANTAIMIDSPFRTYIYEQAVARLARYGQDTTVNIFDLVLDTGSEPNISTRGIDILQWSKEQVAAIMGTDVNDIPEVSVESFWEECADGVTDVSTVSVESLPPASKYW
jgi:SNF2 family DNA or RNA helicase